MAKKVILIAGNICAGKTKFVDYVSQQKEQFSPFLAADESVTIVPEFIDPIALKLFYKDRRKHTEQFEMTCLYSRISRYRDAKEGKGIVIFDRGMIEGAETFCRNSFLEGYLSHAGYEDYLKLVKKGLDELDRTEQENWLEGIVVYFNVGDIGVLQQRQRLRNTNGEVIPSQYLERINEAYDNLFSRLPQVYASYGVRAPDVINVDASVNFHEDKEYHRRTLDKILEALQEKTGAVTP